MLLVNYLHKKCITESQDEKNFSSALAIYNLHLRYNIALVSQLL